MGKKDSASFAGKYSDFDVITGKKAATFSELKKLWGGGGQDLGRRGGKLENEAQSVKEDGLSKRNRNLGGARKTSILRSARAKSESTGKKVSKGPLAQQSEEKPGGKDL